MLGISIFIILVIFVLSWVATIVSAVNWGVSKIKEKKAEDVVNSDNVKEKNKNFESKKSFSNKKNEVMFLYNYNSCAQSLWEMTAEFLNGSVDSQKLKYMKSKIYLSKNSLYAPEVIDKTIYFENTYMYGGNFSNKIINLHVIFLAFSRLLEKTKNTDISFLANKELIKNNTSQIDGFEAKIKNLEEENAKTILGSYPSPIFRNSAIEVCKNRYEKIISEFDILELIIFIRRGLLIINNSNGFKEMLKNDSAIV